MDNCIVLDLDETLISTFKRQFEVIKSFFDLNSIDFQVTFDQYLYVRKKNNFSNFDFFKIYNNDIINEQLFKNYYFSNIEKLDFLSLDSLIVDIKLLKEFKERNNLKLAIISLRNNEVNSFKQIELFGLNKIIDCVFFISHDIENNPKTKVLSNLKESFFVQYFIGDTMTDYEAALESGISFIKVNTGFFDFDYSKNNYNNINHFLNKNINL